MLYPKAVGWFVLLSSALIMEGYDLALLSSLYTAFKQTGKWSMSASWQSACKPDNVISSLADPKITSARSNGARAGEVISFLINSIVSERYGYRKTMIGSLLAMIGFIFVLCFAPGLKVLVLGEVLCGVPWGIF